MLLTLASANLFNGRRANPLACCSVRSHLAYTPVRSFFFRIVCSYFYVSFCFCICSIISVMYRLEILILRAGEGNARRGIRLRRRLAGQNDCLDRRSRFCWYAPSNLKSRRFFDDSQNWRNIFLFEDSFTLFVIRVVSSTCLLLFFRI